MLKSNRKKTVLEDEDQLNRMIFGNGIPEHPDLDEDFYERMPVGEDPREYLEAELFEQGYTDEGLDNPNASNKGDFAVLNPQVSRKIA